MLPEPLHGNTARSRSKDIYSLCIQIDGLSAPSVCPSASKSCAEIAHVKRRVLLERVPRVSGPVDELDVEESSFSVGSQAKRKRFKLGDSVSIKVELSAVVPRWA